MIIEKFGNKNKAPVCLALGFFDSLHKGHAAVIKKARAYARANNYLTAVFTFDNNPFSTFGRDIRLVYTFSERCQILKGMGADMVVAAEFTPLFMDMTAADFLKRLAASCNVKYISCGGDYTFGKNSEGGVKLLKEFCEKNGIALEIVPEIQAGGVKISSTAIRDLIEKGGVETANRCLNAPFCAFGVVAHGRGLGEKLTYPTANLVPDPEKVVLGQGVYATNTYIGGKKYTSVTNAGGKPTFRENAYELETHIISGYNSPLYGQYIKVEFIERIRGIINFSTAAELKMQIAKDIEQRITYNG